MISSKPKRVLEVVMKTCPVCRLDVEDSYLFCPDDGSGLVEAHTPEPSFIGAPPEAEPSLAEASPGVDAAIGAHCGECASDYPMTFVECPVHHTSLTKQRPPTIVRRPIKPAETAPISPPPDSEVDDRQGSSETFSSDRFSTRPRLAETLDLAGNVQEERVPSPPAPFLSSLSFGGKRASRSWSPSILALDDLPREHQANGRDGSVTPDDAPSFRIVAAAIVVGLVLFCVVAVYMFFSAGAKRQTVAHASRSADSAVIEQPPFVPTPDSARDYEGEKPQEQPTNDDGQAARLPQSQNAPEPPPSMPRVETTATDSRNRKGETGGVRPTPVSTYRTTTAGGAGASAGMSVPSAGRDSASTRIDLGTVDARLIRVRSMKTASGVRYDLTFDLQDESGRHSQWERMLVATRSASGVSQTQTVPFVHRLGANGALTFTVSVEMRGQSAPDWHGRVVCTTTGADFDGRPLRASFAANVTP